MATKNRSDLKSYFVKNAIPTESNYADLIDSQLNQAQDGVFKPDGEALSVVAAPGDQKRVLRLYASYPAASPDWLICLHPAQDPANAVTTGKTGFGITDGAGKPRLFIDATTGQIGVGTNTPQAALDVAGSVQANGFRGQYDLVLNDFRTLNPASNTCLQSPANDRDAWIYRDPNDAASNWGIYHRQIDTAVGGLPGNSIGFVGGTGSKLQAYVNLGDGSGFFAGGLSVKGAMDVSATATTWGGWFEALRFSRAEHSAITHPGGKLQFGMHGNRNFYFSDTSAGRHVMTISGDSGNVGILGALTVTGQVHAPGGVVVDSAVGHIDRDGAFYRNTDGQVYLTVDDNLYIRDSGSGANWAARFRTDGGILELKGYVIQYSDQRMKENIEPVVGSLAKVRQLRCVSFDWKDPKPGTAAARQLGLVAQDVQAVVPEAVVETSGDMLAIAYHAITALLVEAVKEQQQHIEELRAALTPTPA